jgi:hypothetical protein
MRPIAFELSALPLHAVSPHGAWAWIPSRPRREPARACASCRAPIPPGRRGDEPVFCPDCIDRGRLDELSDLYDDLGGGD